MAARPRHHHHRNSSEPIDRLDALQYLKPADARQVQIEQHEIANGTLPIARAQILHCLETVLENIDIQRYPGLLQCKAKNVRVGRAVLYQSDTWTPRCANRRLLHPSRL